MLVLQNITKDYIMGDTQVHALRGVSLAFRRHEFVAILGPSGCGKTTLLNLVGGLDRYSGGDLRIDGRSTSRFRDRDWDNYRNHAVGFVFQNYNLIPHQSVLGNVELALTLSGVSKAERQKRARAALERVGLGDQLTKRPNQMSGGQMQRAAIARALVNDPSILLADEPTGALDTENSLQVMEILKEVSQTRLVIMVTHNPELAEKYATRIVRLLDGQVIDDSHPLTLEEEEAERREGESGKRPSMGFLTALSLSRNNLLTKKARTILTAFAGSIGIIGIALILSLSNGIQNYIDRVQEDTLSTYPLTITAETVDMSSMITALGEKRSENANHGLDRIYSNTVFSDLADNMMNMSFRQNDLAAFLEAVEAEEEVRSHISSMRVGYGVTLPIYAFFGDEVRQLNPSPVMEMIMGTFYNTGTITSMGAFSAMSSQGTMEVWQELLDNPELLRTQYDVLAGRWPEAKDEVVVIVDKHNEINEVYLYSLGIRDPREAQERLLASVAGETLDTETESWSYEEILGLRYRLAIPGDLYRYDGEGDVYTAITEDELRPALEEALELRVVGIIRPSENASAGAMSGAIGYLPELTEYYLEQTEQNAAVRRQLAEPDRDVFTGLPFPVPGEEVQEDIPALFRAWLGKASPEEKAAVYAAVAEVPSDEELSAQAEAMVSAMDRAEMVEQLTQAAQGTMGMSEAALRAYFEKLEDQELRDYLITDLAEQLKQSYTAAAQGSAGALPEEELDRLLAARLAELEAEELEALGERFLPPRVSESTLADNLKLLGYNDRSQPGSLSLYAASFEDKDAIVSFIQDYNKRMEDSGQEDRVIRYTDYVGLLMSSVTTILHAISYVLVAFVSISLIVSSIMIGIITYISVLERTREIGVLRSIGASKRDISRVFNAETLIVGFCAGVLGIVITILLNLPISAIVQHLTGIPYLRSSLPPLAGVILVIISMVLTLIAGLIPARLAAKRDPVEALRSE